MARNVKDKNFTGEKDHENLRGYIPEADDTNDDKILKAVARKPNAFFFTNDNNLYTKVIFSLNFKNGTFDWKIIYQPE